MKFKIVLIVFFIGASFISCNKYLDKAPDVRTDLNTPEKIAQLLVTAYPSASYVPFCESMSDNFTDAGSGTIYAGANQDAYYWRDGQSPSTDAPIAYWNACYAAIASSNQALDAISKIEGDDSVNYQAVKGEALVCRAYAHFMLVNLFSNFYDSSSANSDMGIPYVTKPEDIVFKNYDRKTVGYVYSMVEKDLLQGIHFLKDDSYSVPKYHFRKIAAYAFATRFYLFKRDYLAVIKYANLAFPSDEYTDNMQPWTTTYAVANNSTTIANEFTDASTSGNLLLCQTISNFSTWRYQARYWSSKSICNGMNSNPTGGTWAYQWYSYSSTHYFMPKWTSYFFYITSSTGYNYLMTPLFRTEEVLLNMAEAFVYENREAESIDLLNKFASMRIKSYSMSTHILTQEKLLHFYNTTDIKLATIQTILDFRRIEYILEGLRWFDILRYKIPVSHGLVNGTGDITTDSIKLLSGDLKRTLQIPEAAKLSGLTMNPR